MEFSYRLIDSIILSSVALGLGLYAFRIDPKNGRNRLLLLICLWFVVRNTTALIAFAAVKERADLVALFRVNFLFYCTLFAMNLHFFLLLLGKRKLSAPVLALVYLPMLAAGLLGILSPQKLIDFVYREGEWRIRLPPRGARAWLRAFNWTTLLYFTAALSAAGLTLKRAKTNRERRQAIILLGGFSVYYVSQAVQPLLPRATSPSLLVYPLFAYIVSLCYATLRYSFLAPRPSPMTEDLIAHISDAVFLLDADFAVAHSNPAAERLAAAGPLRGKPFASLVRDGAETARRLKTFQGGAELSAGLRIAFAREGNDAAATCYLSKVKDRFGDLVGILVIAKELPGRREFQDRFRVTGREMQVVDLILSGAANQTIGEALGISERTVEAHCLHVYNKLDVKNKTELVKLCAKFDFLH